MLTCKYVLFSDKLLFKARWPFWSSCLPSQQHSLSRGTRQADRDQKIMSSVPPPRGPFFLSNSILKCLALVVVFGGSSKKESQLWICVSGVTLNLALTGWPFGQLLAGQYTQTLLITLISSRYHRCIRKTMIFRGPAGNGWFVRS